MAHTIRDKKKLLDRISRIRGQVNAIENALKEEKDCSTVLLTLAACRGAMNSLMAEILEGHIRLHVLDPQREPTGEQSDAAQELIDVIKSYLR
ncbi:MAG TPA: metal/formaldehyde-sensitive transcriptional repressor [Terrimicrobiaceae bacterium]